MITDESTPKEIFFIPTVELISITPDAENKIVEMARVSAA